ncbi:MAG: amidohydrolase family protein [Pseudomonadota bacterium]
MNEELGGIDCDVHVPVPDMTTLRQYLPQVWQEIAASRGINGFPEVNPPVHAPIACRPDWRDEEGRPQKDPGFISRTVLDERGMAAAICHCLYPVQKLFDPHMAAIFAGASNDYLADTVLNHDPRLYGSILVSPLDPSKAAAEIARRVPDKKFVQVIMLAAADLPYGNPYYDPIWEAAVAADLPVALHLGSSGRHPQTASGWASYQLEDAIDQSLAFQGQLASLVTHGVFERFPNLRFVLLESGVAWVASFGWRFGKFWRGARIEVPWLDEPPMAVIERHVRLTLQPFDAPSDGELNSDVLAHLGGNEMLLYASDFPHWHFDGKDAFPAGLDTSQRQQIAVDKPRSLYRRIH